MGLLRRILEGKAIKDGIRGEAVVLAIGAPTTSASSYQMTSELFVKTSNQSPREVSRNVLVERRKWPMPGTTVPVVVDRESTQPDRSGRALRAFRGPWRARRLRRRAHRTAFYLR